MSAKKCCVQHCNKSQKHTVLHRFPNPITDSERFDAWTKFLGGDILLLDKNMVFKRHRICHSHFAPAYHNGSGRVTGNAVPSLVWTNWSASKSKSLSKPHLKSSVAEHKKKSDAQKPILHQETSPAIVEMKSPANEFSVNEPMAHFGRCRCCRSNAFLKNMWREHHHEGTVEVYGDMIVNCFTLSIELPSGTLREDHMCESCIFRLRDAINFKKMVLESQDELIKQADGDSKSAEIEEVLKNLWPEPESSMIEYKPCADDYAPDFEVTTDEECGEESESKSMDVEVDIKQLVISDPVEPSALELDSQDTELDSQSKGNKQPINDIRCKTDKQYSAKDRKSSVTMDPDKETQTQEDLNLFKIPQTITRRRSKVEETPDVEPVQDQEKKRKCSRADKK